MASLNSLYIKADVLKKLYDTVIAKQSQDPNIKGVSLTVSINDENNDYGQNISAFVEQTKEQREEKKPRFYVGNGKTFWTDGKISVSGKSEPAAKATSSEEEGDLPF